MPVSLGEWRVRIGRFVHLVKEYVIRERKEKLLKERIRRLKLLQKRLLEKKERSEDECESKQNDLSVKVDNAPDESNNNDTTNDSHKEDSGRSSTIKENTTQTASTTYKSNRTDYTFPFIFTLLVLLFSLLLSLIFLFIFNFSNLLESYKPFFNWSRESSWRSTCLMIIIVCSSLAYILLSYVIKNNADIQDSLVLIGDENAKAESTTKVYNTTTGTTIRSNNSPTESNIKEINTQSESTIKENGTLTKFAIKVNNTQTESIIKNNKNTLTESRFKEKNATTESTKECKNIPTNATIKEKNTSDYMTDKPSKRKPSKRNPSRRKPSKRKPSKRNPSRRKPSKRNPSRRKPSKRKTTKKKMTNNTITETIIKANNSPSESIIKDSNTPNGSAIKCNNSTSGSTIKDTTNKSATKENNTSSRPPTEENSNQSMEVNIAQADYTIRSGFQKVLSDGKYISSRIPSSLKGTTEDPVVQESTCLPEMILVKAGDVEQNPGPFDRSADIQEKELLKLAHDVSPSKYTELCIELGESHSQSQGTLGKHYLNVAGSLMEIFCKWKHRQKDGTDCRKGLAKVLCDVELDTLGDKMSKGGYLPQEAAPTASIANEKVPLTTEQVTHCGDDFKTFYRTQLCKIQTDPLNFNLVLEFERIYTDLILLRNEWGATKKTPLEYKELLKTEINGELPKRLMVEGEGGAGKTTFCSKMAWDWTNEADEFREFDWVLVIPLRDIEGNQTVGDIAKTFLSDSNSVQPHQIDTYILANPSKVFIIFDGLDEYDGDLVKQENDIAKIIRSEHFKECRVLVTTRPWKADQIKSNSKFGRTYAFIGVAGFDEKHISIYIEKYFLNDPQASKDLIKLLEGNDVIRENMAPFPIYIAMLCILWQDSDSEKRKIIRRLKTFSQLFQEIIIMLKEHYVSKRSTELNEEIVSKHFEQLGLAFTKIGEIALSGVMDKKLGKAKSDFSSCKEAMETCCKVGVLSKEKRLIPKRDRHKSVTSSVTENVIFPHKLFQEYLAGMYLASLFESEQYEKVMNDVIQRAEEFRYLLYFTACQSKNVAFDVTKRLIEIGHYKHILVDVTFEAYNEDAAKVVGKHLFAKETSLEIDDEMSAHTVSGYIFIMEKLTMETLILSRRSCGLTVSRDLADVICSSTALTALKFNGTALHDDFYGILEGKVKTSKVERLSLISMEISEEHASRNLARFLNNLPRLKELTLQENRFDGKFYTELASGACSVEGGLSGHSIRKLHLDHQSNNDILQYGIAVERLFPMLEHLYFTTLQTVSPNILGSFAHSGLKELSFATENRHGKTKEDEECHIPLIGDPSSLEQVFLNSFPLLTNLAFNNLVIGNDCCKIMMSSLKRQNLKNLCVIHCYTDEELDPIASANNMENRMQVNIQHDQSQKRLKCMKMSSGLVDALSRPTSIQELILTHETIFSNAWCSEENQRTMNLKIQKLSIDISGTAMNDQTASPDLARFLCLQPCLTNFTINGSYLHDDFYKELSCLASSSKVQSLSIQVWNVKEINSFASRDLAKFLCLQPCLVDLTIHDVDWGYSTKRLHEEFYQELARLASSSKVQRLSLEDKNSERIDPSASRDLAMFLCLQPCLTDLTINRFNGYIHDDFYHELARLASSSKVEKLSVGGCNLERNKPSASHDLAKFLCLLPRLTDLSLKTSGNEYTQDDFYQELARRASSSRIQKLSLEDLKTERNPLASRDLAIFLCLLPRLTDLSLKNSDNEGKHLYLHDDFYHNLACRASFSKVEKLSVGGCNLERNKVSASHDLAKFLCLLPRLTDLSLKTSGNEYSQDDFYQELARRASSSKNRFFNKKSEKFKHMDLRERCKYIRRFVHPTLSEKTTHPTSRACEPQSAYQGSVQQQIEYSPVVTPLGLDVPSTSGINAQSGQIFDGPPARGLLQPKRENQTKRSSGSKSKDDYLDGTPRKRKKGGKPKDLKL